MVIRIRLKQGPVLRPTRRKNRQVALAVAALLQPAACMAVVLAIWRLGADLGFMREFAIERGLFSRWQVWMALGVALVALAAILDRYAQEEDEAIAADHGDSGY